MDILRWFRKKEQKAEVPERQEGQEKEGDLQRICGADKESYQALYEVLLLNPPKGWKETIDQLIAKAEDAEKMDDKIQAARNWRIAGSLALYQDNLEMVKLCFVKYHELSGKKLKILEIPEKALEMARKYYQAKEQKEQKAK